MSVTTLSNYHFIDWWCDIIFCLFTWWFDTRFFTLVLQANRLTKRASQVFTNFFADVCFFVNNILLHFMSTYFSTFYISIGNAVIVQVSFFWEMFLWSDNSTEKQKEVHNRYFWHTLFTCNFQINKKAYLPILKFLTIPQTFPMTPFILKKQSC